jgi:hypothetical protein
MKMIEKIKSWDEDFCGKDKTHVINGKPYVIQPHPFPWLFSRAVILSLILTLLDNC